MELRGDFGAGGAKGLEGLGDFWVGWVEGGEVVDGGSVEDGGGAESVYSRKNAT